MAYISFLCIKHVLAAVKFNYFIFCGAAIILSAMFLGKFVSVSKFCSASAKQFETFLTYMLCNSLKNYRERRIACFPDAKNASAYYYFYNKSVNFFVVLLFFM